MRGDLAVDVTAFRQPLQRNPPCLNSPTLPVKSPTHRATARRLKFRVARVEVDLAPDSATLSWEAADGVVGLTAIPRTQFDDYVRDGKITMEK